MTRAPRSERVHLTLIGCCNAGKSSLLNALTEKQVSIVSAIAGTTTDPVCKSMELGGLGAVAFTDTAGLDDTGELGGLRMAKALASLAASDIAILVTAKDREPQPAELAAYEALQKASVPTVVAVSFADSPAHPAKRAWLASLRPAFAAEVDSVSGRGIKEFRDSLAGLKGSGSGSGAGAGPGAPGLGSPIGEAGPLEGLVQAGDTLVLVTPIDSAAPKGRMILPEAATLRDALDRDCVVLTVREGQLASAMRSLRAPPKLVITDSQAFAEVASVLPPEQPLTSFSILFARKKGELGRYGPGLRYLEEQASRALSPPGEGAASEPLRLLAIEACAHNRTHEDIASVKIPRLLSERLGRQVSLTLSRHIGDALPQGDFDLAVLCGGCMATAKALAVLHRALGEAKLPYINFGLCLAWLNGLYPRAVLPLPDSGL